MSALLPEVTGRALSERDLPRLASTLAAAGLPVEDLGGRDRSFFAFQDRSGEPVGFAGYELYGTDALLRSVVILPTVRGKGYGRAITEWMMAELARRGAATVFLLTTTAAPFFEKMGFRRLDRSQAPAAIAATTEFGSLCPSTAMFMGRAIS